MAVISLEINLQGAEIVQIAQISQLFQLQCNAAY